MLLFFALCNALICLKPRKISLVDTVSIFIAIGKISDFTRHLHGFRLVNAKVKKSDNCIGDSFPSNTLSKKI